MASGDDEATAAEMDKVFAECRRIGAHLVVLTGGEPYLLKDSLLRLFRKYHDIFFLTFTNATIAIRQDAVNRNAWHVSIVSGISVP